MFGDMIAVVKQSCSPVNGIGELGRVSLVYYSMIVESTT